MICNYIMFGIFRLVLNSFTTAFSIIGIGTVTHKLGTFFKIMDKEEENGFKKAFDKTTMSIVEEIHFMNESVQYILKYTSRISLLLYDIGTGNKTIRKTKDGNLIIIDTDKLNIKYEEQIMELKKKLQKYESRKKEKTDHEVDDDDNDSERDDDVGTEYSDSDVEKSKED